MRPPTDLLAEPRPPTDLLAEPRRLPLQPDFWRLEVRGTAVVLLQQASVQVRGPVRQLRGPGTLERKAAMLPELQQHRCLCVQCVQTGQHCCEPTAAPTRAHAGPTYLVIGQLQGGVAAGDLAALGFEHTPAAFLRASGGGCGG
jgi:hypothetical protein